MKTDNSTKNKNQELTKVKNQIIKIGGLLSVGFGEAGSLIIANHFSSSDGELKKGEKKIAIFGFCDIRNFTDVTEVI